MGFVLRTRGAIEIQSRGVQACAQKPLYVISCSLWGEERELQPNIMALQVIVPCGFVMYVPAFSKGGCMLLQNVCSYQPDCMM